MMHRRNFLTGLFVAPAIIPAHRLMRLSPVKIERWVAIPDPGRGETQIATTRYVKQQAPSLILELSANGILWQYSLQSGGSYQWTRA
jgi:hypothetical protein